MIKSALTLFLLFLITLSLAQYGNKRTLTTDVSKTTTLVIYQNYVDTSTIEILKKVMKENWKLSKYEFLPVDELVKQKDKYLNNPKYTYLWFQQYPPLPGNNLWALSLADELSKNGQLQYDLNDNTQLMYGEHLLATTSSHYVYWTITDFPEGDPRRVLYVNVFPIEYAFFIDLLTIQESLNLKKDQSYFRDYDAVTKKTLLIPEEYFYTDLVEYGKHTITQEKFIKRRSSQIEFCKSKIIQEYQYKYKVVTKEEIKRATENPKNNEIILKYSKLNITIFDPFEKKILVTLCVSTGPGEGFHSNIRLLNKNINKNNK